MQNKSEILLDTAIFAASNVQVPIAALSHHEGFIMARQLAWLYGFIPS